MAGRPMPRLPITNQVYRTVVTDENGQPILEITAGEYMIPDGNGMTILKNGQSILLMDGTEWNPAMAIQQGVKLACCELCRHPPFRFPFRERPRHGLVSKWKRCVRCGRAICPRHRHRTSDGSWRCSHCRHGIFHWLREILLRLFTYTEE